MQGESKIDELKKHLSGRFEMKDLGPIKQILGIEIARDRKKDCLSLSQKGYIEKVLEMFDMNKAKLVKTSLTNHFKLSKTKEPKNKDEKKYMEKVPYASMIGSLMFAMLCTRPDIAHAVGVLSRFMTNPEKAHWEAAKWLLRYLRGTTDYRISYSKDNMNEIVGFVDASYACDLDKGRSTMTFIFGFGNGPISWVSRLLPTIALSSCETEYMTTTEACKEVI